MSAVTTRRPSDLPQPPRVVGQGIVKRHRRARVSGDQGPSPISREFCRDFLRAYNDVFCATRPWLRDGSRDCFGSHGGFSAPKTP